MQVGLRLKQLLKEYEDDHHGAIKRICKYTKLKRHEVSALLGNRAEYVRLDALADVCRYFVHKHKVNPADLPGLLLALEPGDFWSMIGGKRWLEVCFGVRTGLRASDISWVMAADSLLHGQVFHEVFALGGDSRKAGSDSDKDKANVKNGETGIGSDDSKERLGPPSGLTQKLVSAYKITTSKRAAKEFLDVAREEANQSYDEFHTIGGDRALVCLGSVKSNVVIERVIAEAFGLKPFESLDNTAKAADRKCPFYFCVREDDAQPVSCHAGTQLSVKSGKRKSARCRPGIHYKTSATSWECFPWDVDSLDAALIFYIHKKIEGVVEVVIGGFSSRATFCLAAGLPKISDQIWPPTYATDTLEVGAFVVQFEFGPKGAEKPDAEAELGPIQFPKPTKTRVVPISREVLKSCLEL